VVGQHLDIIYVVVLPRGGAIGDQNAPIGHVRGAIGDQNNVEQLFLSEGQQGLNFRTEVGVAHG